MKSREPWVAGSRGTGGGCTHWYSSPQRVDIKHQPRLSRFYWPNQHNTRAGPAMRGIEGNGAPGCKFQLIAWFCRNSRFPPEIFSISIRPKGWERHLEGFDSKGLTFSGWTWSQNYAAPSKMSFDNDPSRWLSKILRPHPSKNFPSSFRWRS